MVRSIQPLKRCKQRLPTACRCCALRFTRLLVEQLEGDVRRERGPPFVEHVEARAYRRQRRVVRAMHQYPHSVCLAPRGLVVHLGRDVREEAAHAQTPDFVGTIY